MSRAIWVSLLIALASNSTAEARLFRQTYGAIIPTGDGCVWNWHQDYFVPRHTSTGRYDLFSPCKTAFTKSPACWKPHPLYPGYCNVYSRCRYRWRDHVYRVHCGCHTRPPYTGPLRHSKHGKGCGGHGGKCGKKCQAPICSQAPNCSPAVDCQPLMEHYPLDPLPNVEPMGVVLLGSIPLEPIDALTNAATLEALSSDNATTVPSPGAPQQSGQIPLPMSP